MSSPWLLVQSAWQASAVPHLAARLSGCRYLASTPVAYQGLREQGLDALCLFRFLPLTELNRTAAQNQALAARICSSLDSVLEATSHDYPPGFRPFDAMLFQLKSVLDSLAFRQQELSAFAREVVPEAVYYWPRARRRFSRLHEQLTCYSQPFSYASFESAASDLLDVWGENKARSVFDLDKTQPREEVSPPAGFSHFETRLRAGLNFNRLTGLVSLGTANIGRESGVAMRIAVLSSDDEVLAFLRSAVRDPALGIDWWTELGRPPVSMRSGRTVDWDRNPSHGGLGSLGHEGLHRIVEAAWETADTGLPAAVEAVLKDRLTRYAHQRVPQLADLFVRARRYIETRKPDALLTGTTTGDAVQTVGHACRQTGVRLVSFQHGGNFGYVHLPQLAHSDLKVADILCVFGQGVRKSLEEHRDPATLRPTILSLGWARQGGAYLSPMRRKSTTRRQRRRAKPEHLQLGYVATNLMGDRRFGPEYWYDDTAYFLRQIEIIRSLAECRNADLIVKLHFKESEENPLERHLQQSGFEGVRIIRDRPLPELFPQLDVIVLDWPSTTLLEALSQEKRIIYVDLGWLTWEDEARRSLQDDTHWISSGAGWAQELKKAVGEQSSARNVQPSGRFSAAYASADYRPELLIRELGK